MTRLRLLAPLLLILAAATLGACGSSGSSGSSGRDLVKQTFANGAKVRSGQIALLLQLDAQGIKGLTGPVQLRFGGPFDKPATGNAPRFAFTLTGSALGRSFTAGITSTGTAGYILLSGKEFALPAAQFAVFRKSFSSVQSLAQPKTSSSGDVAWLEDPRVVGDADVQGAKTTHVRADINLPALIASLERRRPAAQRLTARQVQGIENVVKDPRFDFYTGASDKILRRVRITFRADVPAASQAGLGGLRTANVTLDYTIGALNQPQRIVAPRVTGTPKELATKTQALLQKLAAFEALAGGGSAGTSGTTGTTGTTTTTTPSSGAASLQRYQACLTQAAGDDAAVKKCLQLLRSP